MICFLHLVTYSVFPDVFLNRVGPIIFISVESRLSKTLLFKLSVEYYANLSLPIPRPPHRVPKEKSAPLAGLLWS